MQAEMLDSTISNSLQLFQNAGFKVRVIMRDGEPWFVAKDVCTCLEIANVSDACSRLDEDERGIVSTDTPSGKQEMLIVSEPGLYSLIGSSKKPEAKAFKRWVNHEVLPSIRKTGGYGIRNVDDMINDPDTAIRLLTQLKILRLQNKQLAMERDEAIRTKSMIGSHREASAMATASAKSRKCAKLTAGNAELKDAVGRGSNWRTVAMMRAEWEREFGHAPSWNKLQKFSADLPKEMKPVKDVEVKAVLSNGSEKVNLLTRYHREAWAKYREYEENLRVSAESRRGAKLLYLRADHTEIEYF